MFKRFILIYILLFAFSNLSFSQCYTVLAVKGEIISEKTGQPIKEMDEICKTDKIIFSTPESKAAVLSPEQGRFVIKLEKKQKNALTAFVSSVLFAGKERLSTKIMDFDELELENAGFYKNEFGENYFIIRESKIFVDNKSYPMNEKNYFYVIYLFDGKEIESRLRFHQDTLFINKDIFANADFVVNPEAIENVDFCYFDGGKNNHTKLTSFKIIFAEEEKLFRELSNYITILKQTVKNDYIIMEQVMYFLNDLYGNVNWYDIRSYLAENFSIK